MTGAVQQHLVGFRRHLRLETVAGEATYLFSENGVTAVQAERLERLAPLLDGTRDVAALLRAEPDAGELVRQLAQAGLLCVTPADTGHDPATLAYWDAAGLDGPVAADAVTGATVHLEQVGDADDSHVRAALAAAGLSLAGAGPAGLSVVVCSDYLDSGLDEVDRRHRAVGRPWLLAKPIGTQLWLGPVFTPGGPCWHCLVHRLWIHRRAEAHVQNMLGRTGPVLRPSAAIGPLGAAAGQLVALEAAKWLAGHRYPGQRAVWTLDTLTMQGQHHELRARPQCSSCGDADLVRARTRRPVVPVSRPKAGGGHRSLSPEQVLAQYGHLISPVTGLVREICRDERVPPSLHSYRAGANLATACRGIEDLRGGLRSEHGGKGVTAVQAEVSALCEALERHSGSYHGDELRIRARLRELGDDAIHPNALQLFHERQYENRVTWNAKHSPFQFVGEPFDPAAEIDWTPVWSLTGRRQRLVPTALLYFGTPARPGARGLRADSNGSAAGSSPEDALVQGFCELVERDAAALWWYNRTRMPAVDLDAFGDEWIAGIRETHARLGREVWVLDLTTDLEVPTMVALSRRVDKPAEDIVFGFGAHLDPRIALQRALAEVNQLLPAVVEADSADAGYGCDDAEARDWWQRATVANQPYLVPAPGRPARRPGDYRYRPTTDLRDDVRTIERLVAGAGMELLVLDQTRPDIGLPVLKVMVPGLRHFWARFAPGRLYDVPVTLGRLAAPTAYEDLNPIPIFV